MTLNDISIILFLALLGLGIGFLVVTLRNYFALKQRLNEEALRPEYDRDHSVNDLDYISIRKSNRLVSQIDKIGERLLADGEDSGRKLQLKLIRAGFFSDHAPRNYRVITVAMLLGMPLLLMGLTRFRAEGSSLMSTGMIVFVGLALGYYVPELFIRFRTTHNKEESRRGFPDLLDLLVVASEAGLSLEAALSRVGDEIIRSYTFLGQNVRLMIIQVRLGQSLYDAMAGMVDRIDIPEVRSFVTTLQQSREYGTSISDTLRVFSEDMRDRRQLYAEEKAMELPVKLIFPLALFMLPCVFIVALLPIYIHVKELLGG